MNLRRDIFLRVVGLMSAMIVVICATMVMLAVWGYCEHAKEQFAMDATLMARRCEDLMLWDDRVGMQSQLQRLLALNGDIAYVCIDRDAKTYMEILRKGVIKSIPPSPPSAPTGPQMTNIRMEHGAIVWEFLAPIGNTGGVVRIGVLRASTITQAMLHVRRVLLSGAIVAVFGGLLAVMIAKRTTQEVDNLKENLEQLVVERTKKLNDLNRQLELDLEQRKQIEADLTSAKKMAELLSRTKSEFLANMSHEIRTPMTAILGFVDLLEDVDASESERRKFLTTIRSNGHHLLGIINDILDISKIESGKMTVEHITCSPHRLVEEVAVPLKARAEAKGLMWGVEYRGPIPAMIQTDPMRLRQILINLLSNAIKFTETGGVRLVVTLLDPPDSEEPHLAFEVVDTGVGMTIEQWATIFRPFSQADASMTRRFGGTGLGLIISKRLAKMLGGDITGQSVPGGGSLFVAIVATGPLDNVAMLEGIPEPVEDEEQPVHDAIGKGIILSSRILLVEDGPDNQRLIALLLRKSGAEVEVAENGKVAIEKEHKARQTGKPFDCILMDMQMPVMDGYEATCRLRQDGCNLPIIALTAHAMQGDREQCMEAGCTDYLRKPINRAVMLDMVARHCRLHAKMIPLGHRDLD